MDIDIGTVKGIMMLLFSAGVGLGGKFIYDYFKLTRMPNDKNGGPQAFRNFKLLCEQKHIGTDKSINVLEAKVDRIDKCMLDEKIKVSNLGNEVVEHEKRLDRGMKKFDEIKNDISHIRGNVAILLDRSTERRKTDFSKGVSSES